MILDNNILQLDIKLQDPYREIISKLGKGNVEITCVILGDSDIDYELSQDMNNAKILNAPYSVTSVKYPLVYNGLGKSLVGKVTCFARKIDSASKVNSLYTYPTNKVFSYNRIPPTLENGFDWDKLEFTADKMGYILFFQTLLDFYVDDNGVQQRVKEQFSFNITFNNSPILPSGWEIIIDQDNGSLLIGKNASAVTNIYNGKIEVQGKTTSNKKVIEFNF